MVRRSDSWGGRTRSSSGPSSGSGTWRLGQHQGVDRRVSAAYALDGRPALIATFLGRRAGRAGREMERVLAVRVDADGRTTVVAESRDWLPAIEDGAPTRAAWETHFAAWGNPAIAAAAAAARTAFGVIADEFARDHARILNQERKRLDDWLKGRADEICGEPRDEGPTLFDRIEPEAVVPRAARSPECIRRRPGRRDQAAVRGRDRARLLPAVDGPAERARRSSRARAGAPGPADADPEELNRCR